MSLRATALELAWLLAGMSATSIGFGLITLTGPSPDVRDAFIIGGILFAFTLALTYRANRENKQEARV